MLILRERRGIVQVIKKLNLKFKIKIQRRANENLQQIMNKPRIKRSIDKMEQNIDRAQRKSQQK